MVASSRVPITPALFDWSSGWNPLRLRRRALWSNLCVESSQRTRDVEYGLRPALSCAPRALRLPSHRNLAAGIRARRTHLPRRVHGTAEGWLATLRRHALPAA